MAGEETGSVMDIVSKHNIKDNKGKGNKVLGVMKHYK